METKNYIFWGSLGVAAVVLIVLIVKKNTGKGTTNTNAKTPPTQTQSSDIWGNYATGGSSTGNTGAAVTLRKDLMLFKGIQNAKEEVKALQKGLNTIRSQQISEDGIFGDETKTVLLQETQGLKEQITLAQFDNIFGTTTTGGTVSTGGTGSTGSTNTSLIDTRPLSEKAADAKKDDGWYFIGGYFNPFNYAGWAYDAITGS